MHRTFWEWQVMLKSIRHMHRKELYREHTKELNKHDLHETYRAWNIQNLNRRRYLWKVFSLYVCDNHRRNCIKQYSKKLLLIQSYLLQVTSFTYLTFHTDCLEKISSEHKSIILRYSIIKAELFKTPFLAGPIFSVGELQRRTSRL